MNERKKEIMYAAIGFLLCCAVFGSAVYQTYLTNQEYDVSFKVFETECLEYKTGAKTMVLTWGTGKYQFLGNWTGQFIEGESYNITYVHQAGPTRMHLNLIVIAWEEI